MGLSLRSDLGKVQNQTELNGECMGLLSRMSGVLVEDGWLLKRGTFHVVKTPSRMARYGQSATFTTVLGFQRSLQDVLCSLLHFVLWAFA